MTWVSKLCKMMLKDYDNDLNEQQLDDKYNELSKRLKNKQQQKEQQTEIVSNKKKDDSIGNKGSNHGKKATVWHDGTQKITKSALASLDRSKEDDANVDVDTILSEGYDSHMVKEARAAYLPSDSDIEDDDEDNEDDDSSNDVSQSFFSNMYASITGQKVIQASDLEIPLQEMETRLESKNVGIAIAAEICNSVRSQLLGKRLPPLMTISSLVRASLEKIISKMLNHSQQDFNLLHQVWTKRDNKNYFNSHKKEPYVIVMVGINGVGKSTTLAKIAYYLKNNKCSPIIAACDTFRSGAVEQLAVHAKCLDIPLFHKGYAKDSSQVAQEAIQYASTEGHDVVLVDTAGRMQNNAPLMKALNKLVKDNNPDLVIFVCEALVGNDGIDELNMFNSAIRQGNTASRHFNGIVLTKFDTVGNKVGAVLTMMSSSKESSDNTPQILFLGVGQKYNHLKKLSPKLFTQELFS